MDKIRIKNVLSSYHSIHESIIEEYKKLMKFATCFQEAITAERLKMPYHINVIDELHINENGHSRILLKLLQFQDKMGEYVILQSLLQYIKKYTHSTAFSQIEIRNPHLTQEEARIDLWLRDNETGYAIIFENKVYDAVDQEEQLARYIDKTKAEGFSKDKIFVVYLSSDAHEPGNQSWGKYREEFRERYVNLSFREDILSWLRGSVLPISSNNDNVYLYTSVVQYIDYLEGYFNLRTINKLMNMNLDNLIIKQFELGKFSTDKERIKVLQDNINDMNEVIKSMESLQERYRQSIFEEWKKKTKELFPELQPCERGEFADVSLTLDGKKADIFINSNSRLYCQLEFSPSLPQEDRNILGTCIENLKDILPDRDNLHVWKYFSPHEYDEVFQLFIEVVDRCKQIASNG